MKNILHKAGDMLGGRYLIVDDIGQGGMQEVYRAQDLLLKREVAVKSPKNASAEKRFRRSAVLSARINHANVAKTLDYLEDGERFYLVEELINGCDLAKTLKSHFKQLDPYTVCRILHHLAKGLSASHHVGVVHRDLKPSNIMVVGGRQLDEFKITDFGVAAMAENEIGGAAAGLNAGETTSQTALGALPYMAPEAIEDFHTAGSPADVWALGAITYEMLTGERPFGQGYKAIPKIQAADLSPLPNTVTANPQYSELAGQIYGLITKCIRKDSSLRPTAEQLVGECEMLCYSVAPRQFGTIKSLEYGRYGFIKCDTAGVPDVFYHIESIFGVNRVAVGQRVWFARHPGSPRDRAFPVVLVNEPETLPLKI